MIASRVLLSGFAVVLGCIASAKLPAVVTRSITLRPGVYYVNSADIDRPALEIKGDNIVVNATGVVLRGSRIDDRPDQRAGLGVRVSGKNVTVRGLSVHGYKVGLRAKDATGLKVLDGDFSYNWKQELMSDREREDLSDWMSFHQNEKGEWLRFGAGVYLDNCDHAQVKRTTVVGGQCGLMITQTDHAQIVDNNFSFLSAVGLGMYRSSDNAVMHNKIDWCVRGYSHGIYNRGQDSTGILIYEQSHRNKFGFNSVTHGGDGFFLWAGQTTMDTGKGGCNDNMVYGNDFSHAPTNGIEATFSRNSFVNNLIMECWHGVWGGYSYDSLIANNVFAYNGEAIAIEHGQNNTIHANAFYRDANAIRLWMNPTQDPNWGYPKSRNTNSQDYTITDNAFRAMAGEGGTGLVHRIDATKRVRMAGNTYANTRQVMRLQGPESDVELDGELTQMHGSSRIELKGTDWNSRGLGQIIDPRAEEMAAVMKTSGVVVLPYPGGVAQYRRNFANNWDPYKPNQREIFSHHPMLRRPMDRTSPRLQPIPGAQDPFLKPAELRGRRYILVDNWGPYDFQRPILWLRDKRVEGDKTIAEFELLGPSGDWTALGAKGATLSASSGKIPGLLRAVYTGEDPLRKISLRYKGRVVTTAFGQVLPAGEAVPFGWTEFSLPLEWRLEYWNYALATQDPRQLGDDFAKTLGAPVVTATEKGDLGKMWWRSPATGVQADHFATRATTEFKLPPGDYVIEVTADDGVRAWLDGERVLDEWKYSGPTTYQIERKLGGTHRLELKHFELDGFAQLTVKIRPKA